MKREQLNSKLTRISAELADLGDLAYHLERIGLIQPAAEVKDTIAAITKLTTGILADFDKGER